jgi:Trk K+ transport system NAD-binding subunit
VETIPKEVVVIAGFGGFGQTILEELQQHAEQDIDTIAIIGLDAKRAIQVADEQLQLDNFYKREVFEGDISHPEVWQQLVAKVDLTDSKPIIILCTKSVEDNFRTSLWLKNKYPDAMIIARSYLPSEFAENVSEQNNILNVSINQLVEDNIPKEWLTP